MTRVRRRARRARLALVACALWLAGVEVLPALHEALHDRLAPHRHDLGAIITVSLEETTHRHADGSIHYVASGAARPPARERASDAQREASPVGAESDRTAAAGRNGPRAIDHDARPRTTDVGHAAGLAHHAEAIAPAAPPITTPLPVDRRPSWCVFARTAVPVTLDPLAATARGPPHVA